MNTNQKLHRTFGFTLVELMVAMAITLLLMAGLAKSFGVIGQTIKSGRSKVTLSGKMRNLSFGIRSSLNARTVAAKPPIRSTSGTGYFMYYEGPLTEHTFGLFGAEPTRTTSSGDVLLESDPLDTDNDSITDYYDPDIEKGPTYRRHGRIGDFDDYIAFTAEATGDDWFTGKVPAYLVEDGLLGPDQMEPRVIRSKYAEIIMWASPRWTVDPADNSLSLADNPSAMPLYKDANVDLVPDNIVLHRRILLIRPDLNRRLSKPTANLVDTMFLRPVNTSTDPGNVPAPLSRIYPIGNTNPAELFPFGGSLSGNQLMLRSNWLVGMAPLHHFYDLSLRRIIDPDTGDITGYIAANSLEDLVQPHNRFAHVRYPGSFFGAGTTMTSMPVLALGWNDAILSWQGTSDPRAEVATATAPAWFPVSHPSPRTWTPNGSGPNDGCGIFNGWLLPHFELGDPSDQTTNPSDSTAQWQRGYLAGIDQRWDRTGEDVVAGNILAFDIRGYDPTAPIFITPGADGEPGQAGVDDDGSGSSDVTESIALGSLEPRTELGSFGSDDELLKVTDLGIYNVIGNPIMTPFVQSTFDPPASAIDRLAIATRGSFVDLLYPYLAGSALRERTAQTGATSTPPLAVTTVTRVTTNYNQFMVSDLSQYPISPTALNSIKRSGKLLHSGVGGNIVLFQPTYDTWTDGYEYDGFDQSPSTSGAISPATQTGTVWILNRAGLVTRTPQVPATPSDLQIDTGRYVAAEPETSPPLAIDLPAVSITVRISDPATEEMTQFTVIEELQ